MTPFELDMLDQPKALAEFPGDQGQELLELVRNPPTRLVLTGMGSSALAGETLWGELISAGLAAWSVDAARLMSAPGLITTDTVVIATSQSGASAEVVALLEPIKQRGARLVGVTADNRSPLASAADTVINLGSGFESTVSTKSYLNSLAAHQLIATRIFNRSVDRLQDDVRESADLVARQLADDLPADLEQALRERTLTRVVTVGEGDAAITARYAALIITEAAKWPVQGYSTGEFRHGPYELAGPGLAAFLFLAGGTPGESIRRLRSDLLRTGSSVFVIGAGSPGQAGVLAPGATPLQWMATSSVVAQQLAVVMANARDIPPGEFRYGSKITTTL